MLGLLLDIAKNQKSLDLMIGIINNINNINVVIENLGNLASNIVEVNSSMIEPVTELLMDIVLNSTRFNASHLNLTTISFQYSIENIIEYLNYSGYNLSSDCKELVNYIYFNQSMKDKSLFFFYMQKYFFDSSRNKGDFLTFDNCMEYKKSFLPLKYIILHLLLL